MIHRFGSIFAVHEFTKALFLASHTAPPYTTHCSDHAQCKFCRPHIAGQHHEKNSCNSCFLFTLPMALRGRASTNSMRFGTCAHQGFNMGSLFGSSRQHSLLHSHTTTYAQV